MSAIPPDQPSFAPPPGGWPDAAVTRTAHPRPRRARKRRGRGCVVLAVLLVFAAGAVAAGIALSSGSKPLTPFQQCVASIRAEPASQVLGYTPACLRLPVSDRNAAIAQAG